MPKIIPTYLMLGFLILPLSPAPTNPACYNDPNYRNTHEQECLIDRFHPGSGVNQPGGGPPPPDGGLIGGIGRVLHGISGGLL